MKKWMLMISLVIAFKSYAQQISEVHADISFLPDLAWKYLLEKPVYASPVISDQVVYFGGLDSVFYAIDLISGQSRWTYKTGGEIRSTCSIKNQKICFTSGDGKLYCLDKSGNLIWAFQGQSEKQSDFADYFQSSPVLRDGTYYFGSGDGNIYAVNSSDGSLKWKFQTGGVVHAKPAIGNGYLYIGSFDGFIYALSLAEGTLLWKFKTVGHKFFPKGEVQGNPAFYKGLVIVGARDYNVYTIDARHGYCHFNKVFGKGWVLSNTVEDSVLYMAGADEKILSAVEPATGKVLWKKDMDFLQFGNVAFSENMIYAGMTNGKLQGIDKRTGEKKWTFTTDGYKKNRLKYFKDDDTYRDDIYSIIKSNQQFLEVEEELGGIFSTPALAGEYLVFTSTEGAVYCLKANVK